jgi:hypothetical protein
MEFVTSMRDFLNRSWKHQWGLIFIVGQSPLATFSTMAVVCGLGVEGYGDIPQGAIKTTGEVTLKLLLCDPKRRMLLSLAHTPLPTRCPLTVNPSKVAEPRVHAAACRILHWSNFLQAKLTEWNKLLRDEQINSGSELSDFKQKQESSTHIGPHTDYFPTAKTSSPTNRALLLFRVVLIFLLLC